MVINNTKAVEVSIQAVSPELILSVPINVGSVGPAGAAASAAAGAAASPAPGAAPGRARRPPPPLARQLVPRMAPRRGCLQPTPREWRTSINRERPIGTI